MIPRFLLGALLVLARPLAAQEGSFQTELDLTFTYQGGKIDEPLVAVGGVASPNFAYRADSSARGLAVGATRYFRRVEDDGTTPFELLPYVAHPSFVAARAGLDETARDSYGFSRGALSTIESRFTGDRSARSASLEGAWYVEASTAVHARVGTTSARETDAFLTTEQPSGRVSLGSISPRAGDESYAVGLVRRFGAESSLSLDGSYRGLSTRGSILAGPGSGGVLFGSDTRGEGHALGLSLAGTTLLLDRRLSLEAGFSYEVTNMDVTQGPLGIAVDSTRSIARRLEGSVAAFPLRALSVAIGIGYATRSDSAGTLATFAVAAVKGVTLSGAVRFFPRRRASASLRFSRTTTDTVSPPGGDTFQKLVETLDRAELTGSLRF